MEKTFTVTVTKVVRYTQTITVVANNENAAKRMVIESAGERDADYSASDWKVKEVQQS